MAEEAEIIVEIADELPPEAEIEIIKAEEPVAAPKAKEISPDEGLEALQNNLDQERQARIEAQRRAQAAEQAAANAQGQVQGTQLDLVVNAIASRTQNGTHLKASLRDAWAAGDFDAAAEIQEQMSTNSALLIQLEQGKNALENAPAPRYEPPADPVESLASRLSAQSGAWVRAHPQYATDQRLFDQMVAADTLVQGRGIAVDTPAYFEAVEKTLGLRSDDHTPEPAPAPARRAAPAVAPVSRSGTASGVKPNTVTLSREEVEIAEMMQMTPAEYAKHKLAISNENKRMN